ncbi:MAG: aspartate/glutamate racemase family protein [Flavobacteriaceae bacterium]|nr:aspartate/glutamate racemase family protein [Flavobacteriaceae bacterium]
MKKIGLIGGMSWESSLVYYQLLNELTNERLGGFHSAKCIMESVDFAEIEALQHEDNWNRLSQLMIKAAQNLEQAGAQCIVLCTNTMHRCHKDIVKHTDIPFLHIAQATGEEIENMGIKTVLLLGTKFTMEGDFFKDYLQNQFGIEVMIPAAKDREIVHNVIYNELVKGKILGHSREQFIEIIGKAAMLGAEGVILGCTEIPLLIAEKDVSIPVFDTTRLHARYAVDFAHS